MDETTVNRAGPASPTLQSPLLTRNDRVRLEGSDAATRGFERSDNPYRSGSADGRAWLDGFER